MDYWYNVVTSRKEVREGRSFNPDEFAIALEQVVAGTAPEDYRDPALFFARTCFTRALREHTGMVLRRLAGHTENTAPVLTLITQFGGGKTHTLTTLYHLAGAGREAMRWTGVPELVRQAGLDTVSKAHVAVFVGNAWDPQDGRETPWIDLARQLAGDEGVRLLGPTARTTPPGTETLTRVFAAAGGSVLVLFDEVLNYVNRHRAMADPFHAFIQNLTVAMTGVTGSAAVISLPRSQVEMSDFDMKWQAKITRVVRRVAKDLIVLDEGEISEVIRRRLFENLGDVCIRQSVAKAYANWCFERRAQLPPEWMAVDTAVTEKKAREFLQGRFEACYPFHPATLSVFQRKWKALAQYQQTRGTLAMLAQWVSLALRDGFIHARQEPLITLGAAPLHVPEFRSVVLGQLGEERLLTAIEADIAGEQAHSRVLDADAKGALVDIHRRVGSAILFESSGGQLDRVAHLPELRFAIGEPAIETTSIDNAAVALESKSFFIQRVGSDGFKLYHKAKIDKAVNDRRASLDEEVEVKPAMRDLVQKEFERGGNHIRTIFFPDDSSAVQDSPRLTVVVIDPEHEWTGNGQLRAMLAEWTRQRVKSPRLYPGSLIWCLRKPGQDLREKSELMLAWRRVQREVQEGVLGSDYDKADQQDIQFKLREAEERARDEVWAGYRFIVLADRQEPEGLKVIDLGAGHAGGAETLCGRVIATLKAEALLNESIGAGYLERNWPEALKAQGAWPLASLRQCFLSGAMTRLLDPDTILRGKIVEFVERGEFGLASGAKTDGTYERVWFAELLPSDEVGFEQGVFLLKRDRAKALMNGLTPVPTPATPIPLPQPGDHDIPQTDPLPPSGDRPEPLRPQPAPINRKLRLVGTVPLEVWNRLGTKVLPKLRGGESLRIGIDISATMKPDQATQLATELTQILNDLGLLDKVRVE